MYVYVHVHMCVCDVMCVHECAWHLFLPPTALQNEDIVLRNVLIRHFLEAYEEKRAQVLAETQLKLR